MTDSRSLPQQTKRTEFRVYVTEHDDYYEIEVKPVYGDRVDQFALVRGPDLATAMDMAVPYMRCVAQPDPFADLFKTRHADEARS